MPSILNPIKESVTDSFATIKQHPKSTIALVVLQILFLLPLTGTAAHFIPKILEPTQTILETQSNIQFNEQQAAMQLMHGTFPLAKEHAVIHANYKQIQKNTLSMLFTFFLIFLLFNSIIWYIVTLISGKKHTIKTAISYIVQFSIIAIIFFIGILLLFYNIASAAFNEFIGKTLNSITPFLLLTILLLYFASVAIPLIGNVKPKKLFKETIKTGAYKAPTIIIMHLIVLVLIGIITYATITIIEGSLPAIIMLQLIGIFVIVWSKLFIYTTVNKVRG